MGSIILRRQLASATARLVSVLSLRVIERAWAVKLSSPPSTGAPTM